VYQEHNPAKLPEVPALVAKYAGKEEQLREAVCNKYSIQEIPSEPSSEKAEKSSESAPVMPDYHSLITEVYQQKSSKG